MEKTKELSLEAVRDMLATTKVYERENAFIFSDYTANCSDINFILPKVFRCDDDGNVINPITFITPVNSETKFDGVSFMYGDFWYSKRGSACFKCKDQYDDASHRLVRIEENAFLAKQLEQLKSNSLDLIQYYKHASNFGSDNDAAGYYYIVISLKTSFKKFLKLLATPVS